MRKSLKKVCSVALVVAMSCSMMACGKSGSSDSKKKNIKLEKLTASELAEKMEKAAKDDVTSGTASIKVVLDAEAEGQKLSISGEAKAEANADDMIGHVSAKAKVNDGSEKVDKKIDIYGQVDGSDIDLYGKMDDEDWKYTKENTNDLVGKAEEYADQYAGSIADNADEYLDSIADNADSYKAMLDDYDGEIKTKNGCYVLSETLDLGEVKDLVDNYKDAIENTEYSSYLSYLSMIPDAKFDVSLSIDGETFYPDTFKIELADDSVKISGVEIDVDKCEFSVSFSKVGKTTVKIPKDALEAK